MPNVYFASDFYQVNNGESAFNSTGEDYAEGTDFVVCA